MGASISRLQRAGGNRQAAIESLLNDPSPVVAQAKAQYANDPAGFQAWIDRKINETTKGKYHGVLGTIGKVVEKAAPIAALAIPGLGPLAAAGIAAGGNALGRAAQGKSVNIGKELLIGGGAGLGNALTGGAGISGLIGKQPLGAGKDLAGLAKGAAPVGGGGGILGDIGHYVLQHPGDVARLGLGALGAVQGSQAASRMNELQQRALAPLFSNAPNPFTGVGIDIGNPYDPGYARRGQQALRMQLSR